MNSFLVLLASASLACAADAQEAARTGELRQVLQQSRPANTQPASQRELSAQERAELRRQLSEAREARRPIRHTAR